MRRSDRARVARRRHSAGGGSPARPAIAAALAAVMVTAACSTAPTEPYPAPATSVGHAGARQFSAKELECLDQATALSGEGRRDLVQGRDVLVPESTLRFLSGVLAARPTPADLLAATEGHAHARTAVASAVTLVSASEVITEPHGDARDEAIGELDPTCVAPVVSDGEIHGSIDALPERIAEVLGEKGYTRTTEPTGIGVGGYELPHLQELVDMATLLGAGNPKGVPAAGASEALLERAGEIAYAVGGVRGRHFDVDGGRRVSDSEVADALGAILSSSASDLSAFWKTLGRDAQRVGGHGHESRLFDTATAPLLAFDWDEAEGQQEPLVSLLATAYDPDVIFEENERRSNPDGSFLGGVAPGAANVAASDLAEIVSGTAAELLDLPGRRGASIGGISPEVTTAIANVVGPRIYAYVGGDPQLVGEADASLGEEAYLGAFEVVSSSAPAIRAIATHLLDAEGIVMLSTVRVPEGYPGGTVSAREAILQLKRLQLGVDTLLDTAVPVLVAEDRRAELCDLQENGIFYDRESSAFSHAPRDEKRPTLRPVQNEHFALEYVADSDEKWTCAPNSYVGDFDERERISANSNEARITLLSSVDPRTYLDRRPKDTEERAAQRAELADLSTVEMHGDLPAMVSAALPDVRNELFDKWNYVHREDSPWGK